MSETPIGRPMSGNDPIVRGFNTVIVPAGQYSEELFNKLDHKSAYRVKTKRENNPEFHNLVMVTLADLYDNQEVFQSKEVHRIQVKLSIGWVYEQPVFNQDGELQLAVKPLNFFECSQDEREEFWELLKPYVDEQLGPDYLSHRASDHV